MDQPIESADGRGSPLFEASLHGRALGTRDAAGTGRQNQTHSVRRDAVDETREKESWNHTYISPKNHASSSAATPGSTLPSSSSREAPPPVLI